MKFLLRKINKCWLLFLLIGVSFLAYAALIAVNWRYGTLRAAETPKTILFYGLAFLSYLGLLLWIEKHGISKNWLWGGAILFRLMMLFTTPTLSDDIYRYLWDGYVANEGVSPYEFAINAAALDYLDIPQRAMANNAWMASPYLPAAQIVFYANAAIFPLKPLFLQVAMLIFDLGAAWIIARLLVMALLPGRRLFIYLWNPLVIVEVAHGGHIDAWMVLLALLAVYFGLKQKGDNNQRTMSGSQSAAEGQFRYGRIRDRLAYHWLLSPIFLSLATLTKLLPVLLLPVLFWKWQWRQRVLYAVLLLFLLLPFGLQAGWGLSGELDGVGLFGALRIYGSDWKFNSGIFHWLELGLAKQGFENGLIAAKLIVGLVLLGLLTAVWLVAPKHTTPLSTLRLMSLPLMGYVLMTPTIHPWYLLFLLAFVPFLTPAEGETRWLWLLAAPWLYLSGTMIFSYLTYLDPQAFGELEWVRQLEWLPTLALLLISFIAAYKFRAENGSPLDRRPKD